MDDKALAVVEQRTVVNVEDYAMPTERLLAQVRIIQNAMRSVMKDGEHYGVIPGTNKPTLLKPGAEKLGVTFRLVPDYDIKQVDMPNLHREYIVTCSLVHAPTGQFFGKGVGSCSTMESKYRYRKTERVCPECGKETILKSKQDEGWFCWQKKGGCGKKFKKGDQSIEGQVVGRAEYEDPADYYNTVLKMAKKRAHVDAILTATAASDIFTQDVEDMVSNGTIHPQEKDPQIHLNIPEPTAPEIIDPAREALAISAYEKILEDYQGISTQAGLKNHPKIEPELYRAIKGTEFEGKARDAFKSRMMELKEPV